MKPNNRLITLTQDDQKSLIKKLLVEQVVQQRNNLHFFRELTDQPAQIDTGYIAQHLVSLVTKIPGGGFRGKGDDLANGAEVKSANFLDSMDAKGATAPRWNFTCNDVDQMMGFLHYPAIYLVSMDENTLGILRFRVWQIDPRLHNVLKDRYEEWMRVLGNPKLGAPNRPAVNFQLFPPHNRTDENFARHGNGRANGFEKLIIPLQDTPGGNLLLHCEYINNDIVFHTFTQIDH